MKYLRLSLFCLIISMQILTGCGPRPTPPPEATSTPAPTPFPEGISIPARIQQRGRLVVGVRYDLPPFGFVTGEGDVDGFDVDLARELARRWLGDADAVEIRQVRSDTVAEHLRAGDIDIALGALIHSQDLEQEVDFGPTYFWDGHALLVHASDAMSITAPSDLVGRSVGSVVGTGVQEALTAMVVPSPTVQAYDTFDQALGALNQGQIDAVSDLRRRLVRGIISVPNSVIVGQYTTAPVAAAYRHDEPGLADLMTFTFWDMYQDGAYAELYSRWFPGDPVPSFTVPPGTATLSLAEAAAQPTAVDALTSIQNGGWLRVAMVSDRAPFAYLDAEGVPTGYEVQLVQAMVEQWLGDRTAVEFVPTSLEQGLGMVSNGEADMLVGAVPWTRETESRVDFSPPIYISGQGLMVLAGSAPEGVAGLNGQMVAVVSGTSSADVLRRVGQDAGISIVAVPKPTLDEAIAALQAGEVVAVVGDHLDLMAPSFAIEGVGVTADRLTRRPLAFGLPPGSSSFQDLLNLTLREMAQDGRFETIYTTWFYDAPPSITPWPGEPIYPLRIEVTTPYTETAPASP